MGAGNHRHRPCRRARAAAPDPARTMNVGVPHNLGRGGGGRIRARQRRYQSAPREKPLSGRRGVRINVGSPMRLEPVCDSAAGLAFGMDRGTCADREELLNNL